MRRTVARIAAWTLATGFSIVVANAAVGSVRAQVSDLPQASATVVTQATTTSSAAVTSTSSSSTTSSTTSSSTTSSSTTSSSTPTSTVTTAPTTTAAPATTTAPATTAASGEIKTYAVTGGRVTIEVFPDRLRLLGAVPDAGYSVAEIDQSDRQIEIEFKSGESEVKFKAKVEGGQLIIETGGD